MTRATGHPVLVDGYAASAIVVRRIPSIGRESARFALQKKARAIGGFGRLIKLRDRLLDRDVAIKILDPLASGLFSESDHQRFRREARRLAKLDHPNLPAILDVEFGGGSFLIVFNFVEGRTLGEIIVAETKFAPIQFEDGSEILSYAGLGLAFEVETIKETVELFLPVTPARTQ